MLMLALNLLHIDHYSALSESFFLSSVSILLHIVVYCTGQTYSGCLLLCLESLFPFCFFHIVFELNHLMLSYAFAYCCGSSLLKLL